jgi:uncharacterized membrane protein YebE (DUF533 family)
VVQCLQADPAHRYQSADTLAADLLRALATDGGDATMILNREHREARRRVPVMAGWIVAALIALAGLAYAAWHYLL